MKINERAAVKTLAALLVFTLGIAYLLSWLALPGPVAVLTGVVVGTYLYFAKEE